MRKNGMKGKSGRERDELELEVDMERLGEQGEQRGVRTYFQAFADEFLDILFGENDPFFREEEEYEREAFGIVGGLACGARLEAEFPPGRYGRLQRKLEGLEGKGELRWRQTLGREEMGRAAERVMDLIRKAGYFREAISLESLSPERKRRLVELLRPRGDFELIEEINRGGNIIAGLEERVWELEVEKREGAQRQEGYQRELEANGAEIEELKGRLRMYESEGERVLALGEGNRVLGEEIKGYRAEITRLEGLLQEKERAREELEGEKGEIEERLRVEQGRAEERGRELRRYDGELRRREVRISELEVALARYREEEGSSGSLLEEKEGTIGRLEGEKKELGRRLEEERGRRQEKEGELNGYEEELRRREARIRELEKAVAGYEGEKGELERGLEAEKGKVREREEEISEYKRRLGVEVAGREELIKKIEGYEGRLREEGRGKEEREREIKSYKRQLKEKRGKIEELERGIAEYEGKGKEQEERIRELEEEAAGYRREEERRGRIRERVKGEGKDIAFLVMRKERTVREELRGLGYKFIRPLLTEEGRKRGEEEIRSSLYDFLDEGEREVKQDVWVYEGTREKPLPWVETKEGGEFPVRRIIWFENKDYKVGVYFVDRKELEEGRKEGKEKGKK